MSVPTHEDRAKAWKEAANACCRRLNEIETPEGGHPYRDDAMSPWEKAYAKALGVDAAMRLAGLLP